MPRGAVAILVLFAAAVSAAGCAILPGRGGDEEALRERAERVFREQNRVSSRLMMMLPELRESRPELYPRLLKREREMLEACEPLNDIAVARRDEQSASWMNKMNVPATLHECERRTERVRELMREVE